jgi:hypothetical protein
MRFGRRGEIEMKKLTLFSCALVLSFVTIAAMRTESRKAHSDLAPTQATNGAYRDGLYLGTRAARQGTPYHATTGR